MIDRFGRTIDYMRVSVTDRCNLRCSYCIPNGTPPAHLYELLSYEEILRLCKISLTLGITKFKVTGGEPFARDDCDKFIVNLKSMPGVEQVTITTNGILLADHLDAVCSAGIDGINISLNTLNEDTYRELTGFSGRAVETVTRTLEQCVRRGIRARINTVLLARAFEDIGRIALLARDMPVDVRFIELMPIGEMPVPEGVPMTAALEYLRKLWPDLHPVNEKRGNGPARYYAADDLRGCIGFIGALSDQFCAGCNRIRLTAAGILKPCLCYSEGEDLKPLLKNGCTDEELYVIMQKTIAKKPQAHCFANPHSVTEHESMNRIGG